MNISVNYSTFATKGDLIPPKIDLGPIFTSYLAVQQLWIANENVIKNVGLVCCRFTKETAYKI